MVYQPYAAQYTKKRNISQTRPAIGDDDDITKKSKELAVSKSLGNKEQTPSVMPTGNQKAPAVAARETIVNSAGSQAQKQGTAPNIGSIKAAPNFDMGMARHSGNPEEGELPTVVGSGPMGAVKSVQEQEEDRRSEAHDQERRMQKEQAEESRRRAGSEEQAYYDSDEYNPLGGGPPRRNEPDNKYVPPPSDGSGNDPDGFGDILEQKLLEILGMDPTERARNEAGRALLAARSQAGRGQMGMSGAMLGLQSDVMGEASERAENYVMDRQLDAAKTGVKLEALDRAEQLGLIDWVRSATESGNSADEIYDMLTGPLGMSPADADILMGTVPEQTGTVQEIDGSPTEYGVYAETMGWDPPPDAEWYPAHGHYGFTPGMILDHDDDLPPNPGQRMQGVRERDGVWYHMYKIMSNGEELIFYTVADEDNP